MQGGGGDVGAAVGGDLGGGVWLWLDQDEKRLVGFRLGPGLIPFLKTVLAAGRRTVSGESRS